MEIRNSEEAHRNLVGFFVKKSGEKNHLGEETAFSIS